MPGVFLSHDTILAALTAGNVQFSTYMLFPYSQYYFLREYRDFGRGLMGSEEARRRENYRAQ